MLRRYATAAALLSWRIFEYIGTRRLLLCRNEGVVAQKNLMTDVSEPTFLADPARDKPAVRRDGLVARSAKLAQEPVTRQSARSWRFLQK